MTAPIRRSGPARAACTLPGGPMISPPTARTDPRRGVPVPLRPACRSAAPGTTRAFPEFTGPRAGSPARRGTAR